MTLTGNTTFAIDSGWTATTTPTIIARQDATGGRTAAAPSTLRNFFPLGIGSSASTFSKQTFTPDSDGVSYDGDAGSLNISYLAAVTTYMNTVFSEGAAAAVLAGTTPATCISGCTGTWTLASGTDFTYSSISTATANTTHDLLNVGVATYTLRFHISAYSTSLAQVIFRTVDENNTVAINIGPTSAQLYDFVGGVSTAIGSAGSYGGTGAIGDYIVVVSGTSVSVTLPGGAIMSATTANTTGTKIGFEMYTATTLAFTSMSVKSS